MRQREASPWALSLHRQSWLASLLTALHTTGTYTHTHTLLPEASLMQTWHNCSPLCNWLIVHFFHRFPVDVNKLYGPLLCQAHWSSLYLFISLAVRHSEQLSLQVSEETVWIAAWLHSAFLKLLLTSALLSAGIFFVQSRETGEKSLGFFVVCRFILHNWARNERNVLPVDNSGRWCELWRWDEGDTLWECGSLSKHKSHPTLMLHL